jgi:ribonuclease BN (tRNA processing enzyme)
MFFTQGSWSYMSGMIDVVLKCSEDGQTDMRLVGLKVQEYTMSTCYFLGQRPEMTLGLVPLSGCRPTGTKEAAAAGSTVNFVTGDGTVVTPFVLVPHEPDQRSHGAGAKRSFEQMAAGDSDGTAVDAAGSASAGGALDPSWESQDALPSRLVLSYSPYHRAKSKLNSRRRADLLALGSCARATAPSVCYSVVLPPLPGKFDVKKAEALGVEGRLRGMLVKGQAVTLPSGEIVKPEQCVSAGTPGGTVLIVDCPTPAHAATLLQMKVFWDLVTPSDKAGQLCVVHMSPRQVLSCPDYIAWSKPFPASTATSQPTAAAAPSQPAAAAGKKAKTVKGGGGDDHGSGPPPVVHISCSSDQAAVDRPMFVASERYLRLLHGLDRGFFPLSHGPYQALLNEEPGIYLKNSSVVMSATQQHHGNGVTAGSLVVAAPQRADASAPCCLKALVGWPLMTFVLPPHKQPGLKCEVPDTARLHYYCINGCVCTEAGRSSIFSKVCPVVSPPPPPATAPAPAAADSGEGKQGRSVGLAIEEVAFLGTGAASPFKYRTVSAIYLHLSNTAPREHDAGAAERPPPGMLLDAGDGTYGALVRKMGAARADDAVLGLKMIFISHKHADHISGAANILTRRAELLRRRREAVAGGAAAPDSGQATVDAQVMVVECSVCGQRFGSESSLDMHQRAVHPRITRPPQRGVGDGTCAAGAAPGFTRDEDRLLVVGPLWVDSWLRDLGALEPLSYRFIDCQDLLQSSQSGAREGLYEELGVNITPVLVQHSFPAYGIVLDFAASALTRHERFKLVYSGDTRPCQDLVVAGADTDLLIHEATHSDDMIDKARSDRCSSACPASGFLASAQLKRVTTLARDVMCDAVRHTLDRVSRARAQYLSHPLALAAMAQAQHRGGSHRHCDAYARQAHNPHTLQQSF